MSNATTSSFVSAVLYAAEIARNEAQLRHELENALKQACSELSIPWTPFQLERALKVSVINQFDGPIITFRDGHFGEGFKQNSVGIATDAVLH